MTQRGSDATRKDRNMWKKQVYILDREFIHNEIAYKKKGGPTIIYYGKLVLGILSYPTSLLCSPSPDDFVHAQCDRLPFIAATNCVVDQLGYLSIP